jgi:type IV pilus assembly protein PilQ
MLRSALLILLLIFSGMLYAEDEPLDLDFTDAPVSDILNTIAEISGHNLVLGDGVDGTMSLNVVKMNWPEALHMVLLGQNLSLKNVNDHTWYISETSALANQVRSESDINKSLIDASPLVTEFFHLHYADPQKTLTLIQSNHALLSSRGQVSLDQRTATLVISDVPQNIALIKTLLQTIDVPVREVEIDARIVVVDKSALNAFGVMLGNVQPAPIKMLGSVVDAPTINLPIANPSGILAFGLGKLGGQELDLQLQALETMGDGKIISAPELTVSENQEAYIEQGNEVPFQTSTSSGATQIEFKKAVLGLTVTPQIMEDGSINLSLVVNKDAVTAQDAAKTSTPIISTSEVSTNVRVQNGQTLALGGIYGEEKSTQTNQVPYLSGIPGVGWLFKSNQVSDKYTDLLVFITPKIIEDGVASTPSATRPL